MAYRRIFAALLAAMLLSGCKRAESPVQMGERETVVLDILCEREEWDIVKELCGGFSEQHPEKDYAFSLDEPPQDITTALMSGEISADVLYFTSDMTEELVEAGLLLRVRDDAKRISSAKQALSLDGAQYGYPFSAETYFLYYDRSKFADNEVDDLNMMMSKKLGDTQYSLAMALDDGVYQGAFFLAAGCDIPEDCCSEKGMLAGEYMAALAESGRFDARADASDIKAGFVDGSIAAAVCGIGISEELKSTLGRRFGASALPEITFSDGSSVQLGSLAVYTAVGACADSEHPEDALAFAEWMAGEEGQRLRLEQRSTAPVMLSLCDDSKLRKEHPETAALLAQLAYSHPLLPADELSVYQNAAAVLCDTLTSGNVTKGELAEALEAFRTCTEADNMIQ